MPRKRKGSSLRLRSVEWQRFLRAPDAQLVDDLYAPALILPLLNKLTNAVRLVVEVLRTLG